MQAIFWPLRCRRALCLAVTLASSSPLAAQQADARAPEPWIAPLPTIGSTTDSRLRTEQILGRRAVDGYLVRSASSVAPRPAAGAAELHWSVLAPEIRSVWNSEIPAAENDGALWAGRGLNFRVLTGMSARFGPVSAILAPEFVYQENADFQTIPYPGNRLPQRSRFASPWHTHPSSIDLPLRFGDEPLRQVYPGQSSLTVELGSVAVGAATENLWWGPGIRNALVMSDHAAGVPHLFLRSARPLQTRLGVLEGRWIVGRLTESDFFDGNPANDHRSLGALAVTFRPRAEPDLTLGLTRAVFAVAEGDVSPLAALDIFRNVRRPAPEPGADEPARAHDQLFSLFGRWIFPASGFEVYAEWARFEQPSSLREMLVSPDWSQGYTLGLHWARPIAPAAVVRLQTEVSYLEPSSPATALIETSAYASRVVPHGYTHRGQVLGAAIGPGASSQWIAADLLAGDWELGLFAARTRHEQATHYRLGPPLTPPANILQHDVSLVAGGRGAYRLGRVEAAAEAGVETRFNYLFQNFSAGLHESFGLDLRNYSLRLALRMVPELP